MRYARTCVAALLVALALAGCATAPSPSGGSQRPTDPAATAGETQEASEPDPSDPLTAALVGAWRRASIELDESHIAIISDACSVAARDQLGDDEADLPTALIDARGERVATAILADDLAAIQCFVHLDETAQIATVDTVARLSATTTAAVDAARITVANVTHLNDLPGGRTIAFGRVGPEAYAVKLGFDDGLVHTAGTADGWWSMWWPGTARSSSYSAVDQRNLVIGSVLDAPNGEVVAAVGPASWWLDPAAPAPKSTARSVRALVLEESCASGKSPEGRIDPPLIELDDASITVTFEIHKQPGEGQDCQANAPFPVELTLPEPLGARTLLDGNETPPRDAKVPAG